MKIYLQEKCTLIRSRKSLINILIVVGTLFILACTPDIESPIEKEVKPVKEKVTKKAEVKKTTPVSTASASDIIDYRDVDINLLRDLIHREINKVKKANNLPLLKKDKVLRNAAVDQNNYQIRIGDLSHTQSSSKKKNLSDRIQLYGGGFQAMAENLIYEGFIIRTSGTKKEIISPSYEEQAKKMVTSWMNSPGHRKNIMNPKYDLVGTAVGYNADLHAVFSTQVFGKRF